MPCLIALLALVFPRLTIILTVLVSDYIGEATTTTVWPLLGFFFMPFTTLAYAFAWHQNPQGSIEGLGLVVLILAILMDLSTNGGSAHSARRL